MGTRDLLFRFYGLTIGLSVIAGFVFALLAFLFLFPLSGLFPGQAEPGEWWSGDQFIGALVLSAFGALIAYWTAIYKLSIPTLEDRFSQTNLFRMLIALPLGLGIAYADSAISMAPLSPSATFDAYLFPVLLTAALVLPIGKIPIRVFAVVFAVAISTVNITGSLWGHDYRKEFTANIRPWTGPLMLVNGNSADIGSSGWTTYYTPGPSAGASSGNSKTFDDFQPLALFSAKDYGTPTSEYYKTNFFRISVESMCATARSCRKVGESVWGPIFEEQNEKRLLVNVPNGSVEVDPSNEDIDAVALINSLKPVDKAKFSKTIMNLKTVDGSY